MGSRKELEVAAIGLVILLAAIEQTKAQGTTISKSVYERDLIITAVVAGVAGIIIVIVVYLILKFRTKRRLLQQIYRRSPDVFYGRRLHDDTTEFNASNYTIQPTVTVDDHGLRTTNEAAHSSQLPVGQGPATELSVVEEYQQDAPKAVAKYQALRDLDLFVLDNSIRESTVGHLRGHTLEDKRAIYNEVKKCGFKNYVVASFSHMTRVDDDFVKELIAAGEDPKCLWAFSEINGGIKNKLPDTETVPTGIKKLKAVGMYNVIFEIDLGDWTYNFGIFTMADMCSLLKKWIEWVNENLSRDARILVNFRDPPDVMPTHPERIFELVEFLAKLPENIRPIGMVFEDPRGKALPEEAGQWTKSMRRAMKENGWGDGQLLVHIHEKFGYCEATVLQCLMDGATGVWASICAEGAAMGATSSCVILMNLVRLGNKKVLKKYNCTYLRKAAINVTKLTTCHEPHDRQPIFGPRATDFVYDLTPEEFDLATFFGEKAPIRITTASSPEMLQQHLVNLFGEDEQFTVALAAKMKELTLGDLRKEEYMSPAGAAILFDRAGGKLTEKMRDIIAEVQLNSAHAQKLITEIRAQWDEFDLKEAAEGGAAGDERLPFDTFFDAFMAPYFSCYRCSDTYKALQAIDMDNDGMVDWSKFLVYIKWALNEYPETQTAQEVLHIAFTKGIIPAMRDEYVKTL